jgi:hypothetical protein
VKKILAAILSIVSVVVIISHNAIPHHHTGSDNNKIITCNLFDKSSSDKTNNEHNQKKSFPQHQHFFSNRSFIANRTTIILNKIVKNHFPDSIPLSSYSYDFKGKISENGSCYIIDEAICSSLFFISCNATRGSPIID